ncbi:MAG: hypothetical protein LAN71_17340 [Acidobacteriia bacterium]|nr:hypothetical protein [Terriglobia bacterium]
MSEHAGVKSLLDWALLPITQTFFADLIAIQMAPRCDEVREEASDAVLDKPAVAIALIALIITVGANMWMWSNYYSPAIELLKFQAEKKPVLILTVYPSSVSFHYSVDVRTETTIVKMENATLTYIVREGEVHRETFHIFLSNVGTAPTVAQFLETEAVYGKCSAERGIPLNSTILRPGASAEWIWTFVVEYDCVKGYNEDVRGTVWFSIMTTDGIVTKTLEFVASS